MRSEKKFVFLFLVLWTTACTPRPQVLRVGVLNAPMSLQSWKIRDAVSTLIGRQMHRGLLQLGSASTSPEGFAAKSWRFSDDLKTISFDIDTSKFFSDGTPLTCDAVKESFERLIGHSKETSIQFPPRTVFRCQTSNTFTMTFAEAIPASLFDILGSSVTAITKADGIVGLGPYALEKNEEKKVVLRRQFGGGPHMIEFHVGDADFLVDHFKKGELDDILYLGFFQPVDLPCQKIRGLASSSFWMNINAATWKFREKKYRKAVQTLFAFAAREKKTFAAENPVNSLIPYGVPGYFDETDLLSFQQKDFAQSQKTLLAATKRFGRVHLELRESNRKVYNWDELLTFIDPQKKIFDIKFLSNTDYFKRYYQHQISVSFLGANVSRNDPFEVLSFFRSADPVNPAGIQTQVIDRISERASRTPKLDELRALSMQANRWIIEEGYVAPLFSKRFEGCVRENLTGYNLSPMGPLLMSYAEVRIK